MRALPIFLGVLCAVAFATAPPAGASTLRFSYAETGPQPIDVGWRQSSDPTPLDYNFDTYTTVPVFDWTGNIGPFTSITYDSVIFTNGGFYTPDGAILVSHLQLYGPPESSPHFAPNVWTGVNAADGLPFTLTITAVPEPAGWALMLIGFGGLGGALRLSRRRTSAASPLDARKPGAARGVPVC